MTEDFPDPEERALLKLVRVAGRLEAPSGQRPDDEALWAYACGTADAGQTAEVRAALAEDSGLRSEMLDLMTTMEREATDEEEAAFARMSPPPLEGDSRLRKIHSSLKRRRIDTIGSGSNWRQWFFAGWATAATAACALLLVMGPRRELEQPGVITSPTPVVTPTPRPIDPTPTPPTPTPPASPPSFDLEIVSVTTLIGGTRGEPGEIEPDMQEIRIKADTKTIQLSAMPPSLPADSPVRVWIVGPAGRVVFDRTYPAKNLSGRKVLAFRSSETFPAGRYELHFKGQDVGQAEETVYPFVIKRV